MGSEAGDAALSQQLSRTRRRFWTAAAAAAGSIVPLTDGTYFINRWFATVEMIPKTVVPIGYVGVVVSYYGRHGRDLSGDGVPPRRTRRRRRTRRVGAAARARASMRSTPTPAASCWCRRRTSCCTGSPGKAETHRYDESLRSIDLVTTRRLRAAAAAVGRGAYRLPAGAERHSALRRREEADHADARPDAQRLLPRHRPQEDDAGAVARARRRSRTKPAANCGASSTSSTSSASTC